MPDNFAVVVAPLHTIEYEAAMHELTELQAQGFKVMQQNVIILHDSQLKVDVPYCVYWLERPMMTLVANPEPIATITTEAKNEQA